MPPGGNICRQLGVSGLGWLAVVCVCWVGAEVAWEDFGGRKVAGGREGLGRKHSST